MTPIRALALAAALGLLAACGGGGADVQSQTQNEVRTTTTGQELLDLQRAYEAGALSEAEYTAERQKILERE